MYFLLLGHVRCVFLPLKRDSKVGPERPGDVGPLSPCYSRCWEFVSRNRWGFDSFRERVTPSPRAVKCAIEGVTSTRT